MINKLKQWWASRHQPDAVEVALMNDAVNAEQAMIGLARAFVLDQQRRADETRRAARFKRWMVGVVVVGSVGMYAALGAKALLPVPGVVAKEPAVAMVKLEGQISSTAKLASADKVVPALKRAFEDENVKRVMLYIDSPGGAPVEAERISEAVAELRKKHNKPIQAVIGNLGASAGYMVAMSADEIISAKYSLVGSIGAILQSWDVHRVLDKYDVKAKTYASGKLKGMLNPFEPSTPEGEAKAQALVDELGRQFEMLLVERRGKKLTQPIGNYTTGEVWGGQDALGLGLVDSNGTIETVMSQHPELKLVDFGPFERKGPLSGLLESVDDIAVSLREGVGLLKAAAPR